MMRGQASQIFFLEPPLVKCGPLTIVLQLARYRCLSLRSTVTLELWLNDTSYPKSVWKSGEEVPHTKTKHLFFLLWQMLTDNRTQYDRQLEWHFRLSVRPSMKLCTVAKRFMCLNMWTESAPRNTILQIATPYTDHIPEIPYPQDCENLLDRSIHVFWTDNWHGVGSHLVRPGEWLRSRLVVFHERRDLVRAPTPLKLLQIYSRTHWPHICIV